jgi:hypothetical protein
VLRNIISCQADSKISWALNKYGDVGDRSPQILDDLIITGNPEANFLNFFRQKIFTFEDLRKLLVTVAKSKMEPYRSLYLNWMNVFGNPSKDEQDLSSQIGYSMDEISLLSILY